MTEIQQARGEGSDPRQLWRGDFLLFALSRGASVTASQMLTVAVGWTLYQRTGDPLDLGLVGLFRFLPILLLFLVAGVVVDRYDRPRIIGVSNAGQAISASLIGLLLVSGSQSVWQVFLLLALHGASQAFLQPAQQTTLPDLVPKNLLGRAVAVTTTVVKAAQLGGPALAGLLLVVANDAAFFVIAGLSVVAGICAAMIRAHRRDRRPGGFGRGEVLAGFSHIRRTPIVLGAITIDLIAVLFGGVVGLLPVFAIDILNVGPGTLGVMRSMPAVGGLAMGLLLGSVASPRGVGPLFFAALAGFGASILVFSLSTTLWLSLAALAIYGATDVFSVYVRQTLVQLGTPESLRGRVNAVNSVSINASNELGDFRAGVMAAAIGAVPSVALGAVVTLLASAAWWKLFPELRRLDRL